MTVTLKVIPEGKDPITLLESDAVPYNVFVLFSDLLEELMDMGLLDINAIALIDDQAGPNSAPAEGD